jgi:hypothetical protein
VFVFDIIPVLRVRKQAKIFFKNFEFRINFFDFLIRLVGTSRRPGPPVPEPAPIGIDRHLTAPTDPDRHRHLPAQTGLDRHRSTRVV